MGSRNGWPTSIWPTCKPARPIGPDIVQASVDLVEQALRHRDAASVRATLPLSFAAHEHARRTHGIALGRMKARLRMEQFVVWLRRRVGAAVASEAAKYFSPEAWVLAQAQTPGCYHRARLIADKVGGQWARSIRAARVPTYEALIRDMLNSADWRNPALPWQREEG